MLSGVSQNVDQSAKRVTDIEARYAPTFIRRAVVDGQAIGPNAAERFIEIVDRHVPYLLRKAEIIEEYLQQR